MSGAPIFGRTSYYLAIWVTSCRETSAWLVGRHAQANEAVLYHTSLTETSTLLIHFDIQAKARFWTATHHVDGMAAIQRPSRFRL